jgi:tetratricopeptide (TPR) repeat protein
MEPTKKNRIRFESVEPESKPDITQYETDDYTALQTRQYRENSSFLPWLLFLLLFLIVAAFGIWYQFLKGPENSSIEPKIDLMGDKQGSLDRIFERAYLPESSLNPGLAKCINMYKERLPKKAVIACEEFMNSPSDDKEKSIALTVMGVMADEQGRYPYAVDRLKKAIDYDPKNVYAYYNLTLAFKHAGMYTEARVTANRAREIAPNDSRVALLAGNILNESNDARAAIEAYKEGISGSPNDPYLIYNLALSEYKSGKTVEAIENFRKAIQLSGNSQVAEFSHGYLGAIFFHRDDLDGAEHHFREAAAIKPTEPRYLYNLGLILLKKKKNEEAVSFFQKAVDNGAGDPQIYRYISDSFVNLKMYDNAIAALEKAYKLRPDDVDTMFSLADLYYNRGQLGAAEDLYRKIIRTTPGDVSTENAYVNLGVILDDMERFSEAIEVLEKAISLNSKNENAYFNLGMAYKNSGQPTKAIETWRKAANLSLEDPGKFWEAIGDYYYDNGFYTEATKEFEQLAKLQPLNYLVKLKLSDAYFKSKSYDQSEKILVQVLNNSKNPEELKLAHRKLALVYSEGDTKNKSKAKDAAYKGSHIDPEDMESKLVLAKVLMESNSLMDREKAIDELTAIVRSDVSPKIAAKAYNYLGLCYYKNGEFKKSMREFQNAIDLDSTYTEAYENKRAARAQYEDAIQNRAGLR